MARPVSNREWQEKWHACRAQWEKDREAMDRAADTFDSAAALPPMRYRMRLHQETVRLLWWPLYSVRLLEVHDNSSGKRIAWARGYHADTWWFTDLKFHLLAPPFDRSRPRQYVLGPGRHYLRNVAEDVFAGFPAENRRKWAQKPAPKY